MSKSKRPGILNAADIVNRALDRGQAARPEPEAEPAPETEPTTEPTSAAAEASTAPYWRKYTTQYRTDQLDRLEALLARLWADEKVKINLAEFVRLALDKMLADYERDPDQVLLDIYRQQRDELRAEPRRKHAPTRNLPEYLRHRGKL